MVALKFTLATVPFSAYTAHFSSDLHRNQCNPNTLGHAGDVEGKIRVMNASDLRDKTPDELKTELANLKKEAFNLRFQAATNQLEGTARMRTVKRDAARVKTILNEKARAAAKEV